MVLMVPLLFCKYGFTILKLLTQRLVSIKLSKTRFSEIAARFLTCSYRFVNGVIELNDCYETNLIALFILSETKR